MTDKLLCPFCNETELEKGMELQGGGFMLGCPKCKKFAHDVFWLGLIRTRKALEIAVDKLKGIKAYYDDSYADPHTFVNWHIVAQRLANDADDAIKAITALEQKDVK